MTATIINFLASHYLVNTFHMLTLYTVNVQSIKFQLPLRNCCLPSSSRMVTTTSLMSPAVTRPFRVSSVTTRCATKSSSISRIKSSKMTISATAKGFPWVKVTFCIEASKSTSPVEQGKDRQLYSQEQITGFHMNFAKLSIAG